ncbi:MAG TPA: hydantoinase/oxoprolinase family protein, partial [Stellaceae bacterium]|nr:hydantoinase/oxoprolinase family protein [Stellaceae bacterium]
LDRFHAIHERLYGVRFHVPVELVALRVIAIGATPNVEEAVPAQGRPDLAKALMDVRPSYFGGAWADTPNYDRAKLAVGTRIAGPAIVRQYDTTTVLLPRHTAEVDGHGNLLIWPVSRGN